MTSRSGIRQTRLTGVFFGAVGLALFGISACDSATGLEVTPEAKASCANEEASAAQQAASADMLPGRVCGACHRAGGQATNSPWTVSGTVYGTPDSACNDPGVSNVFVEVLYGEDDPNGGYQKNETQPNGIIKTTASGNFYTAARFTAPMKIRVFEGDRNSPTKSIFMQTLVGKDPTTGLTTRVDCNSCHHSAGIALTRVYLR